MPSVSDKADPVVLRVSAADVIEALGAGVRDFQEMPLYGLSVGAFYAAGGLIVVLSATAFGMVYLLSARGRVRAGRPLRRRVSLGLIETLPVLGHATWHLYRRIVAPVAAP